MFCKNCGKENAENAVFCNGCGSALNSEQASEQPVTVNEGCQEPVNPVISVVKKTLSSTLFLVLAILLSVAAAFSLPSLTGADTYSDFVEAFNEGYEASGGPELQFDFYEYQEPFVAVSTGSAVINLIPLAFVVAGVWVLYASAKNKDNGINAKGFKLIKTGTVIQLVVSCTMAFVLLILGLVAVICGAASMSSVTEEGAFMGIFLLVMGLMFLIMLPFFLTVALLLNISALKAIKSISETAQSGVFTKKISMLLIVMLFISAVGGGSLVMTGAYIIAAIILINYNKDMQSALEAQKNAQEAEALNN